MISRRLGLKSLQNSRLGQANSRSTHLRQSEIKIGSMKQVCIGLMLIVVIFMASWIILAVECGKDTSIDVDLGVATSELSLSDRMRWSLPAAIVISVVATIILFGLSWIRLFFKQ